MCIRDSFAIAKLLVHKVENGTSLSFNNTHTVFKLLCRKMTDVFIAPKLWLRNIPDFNDVDYRI